MPEDKVNILYHLCFLKILGTGPKILVDTGLFCLFIKQIELFFRYKLKPIL